MVRLGKQEKALKYIVNINGTLYETTNNYYQVPTSDRTSPDGFSIQVKTISNDSNYLDSLYSNTLTKLSTIKNITFVDGILSWDPVVGNQGYELKINNTIVSTNTNSFDLNSLSTNTYTISIHAKRIEDTKSTFHSEKVTIVVEKNGFSLNLKVQDYMIKWNGIVDATKYNISINGELVDTTETSYLLTNGVVGTNNIKVYTTVGSTYYFSSITVTKPSNITNFKLLDDTFTWDNVENATGYEVYVNGTIYDNKNSTTFALDDCFESGEYLVKIKAYSINSNYVYSNESSEISTTKLSNDINITNLNGELNWNPIANATNYQLLVGDNIYTTASTTYNLPLDGGEYVVSVKAVGDGVDYVISKESSSVTFTKLPKPILSYENWQISFNEITNATGYKLYYGDEIVELVYLRTYTIQALKDLIL